MGTETKEVHKTVKRKSIELKKPKTFLIVVALALLVSLVVACGGVPGGGGEPGGGDWTLDAINELQESPSDDTIEMLRGVIEDEDPELDPYLRERAIFVLTDVSIMLDRRELEGMEMERVSQNRDYLKEIALNQEMPASLQSAALANIDLTDELFPPERHGAMHVDVRGELKPGSQIAIIVTLFSQIHVENARVNAGVVKLYSPTEDDQVRNYPIITPIDVPSWEGEVELDTLMELRFDFRIEQEGEMKFPVSYKFTFDGIDYEIGEQSLYFTITSEGGGFSRLEQDEELGY